jgi:hypothetical protein
MMDENEENIIYVCSGLVIMTALQGAILFAQNYEKPTPYYRYFDFKPSANIFDELSQMARFIVKTS